MIAMAFCAILVVPCWYQVHKHPSGVELGEKWGRPYESGLNAVRHLPDRACRIWQPCLSPDRSVQPREKKFSFYFCEKGAPPVRVKVVAPIADARCSDDESSYSCPFT